MDVPPDLVALGVVRGAYGVKGWVRIQPLGTDATLQSARPWWLQLQGGGVRELTVSGVKPHSGVLLAKWDGCETPELADQLKGATVAVARSQFPALPAGEVYWVDLIGARVVNRSGTELGTVAGLSSNGAQDLLEVRGAGGTLLVPMVPSYVESVDVAAREVRVDWEADWS
jgi:16S rRNA processing protein RimM